MALTSDDVKKVAVLSRLALTEQELQLYTGQLGKILTYVDKLSEPDTSKVEPMITAAASGISPSATSPRRGAPIPPITSRRASLGRTSRS